MSTTDARPKPRRIRDSPLPSSCSYPSPCDLSNGPRRPAPLTAKCWEASLPRHGGPVPPGLLSFYYHSASLATLDASQILPRASTRIPRGGVVIVAPSA